MSGKCGKRLRASVRLWQPKKKVVPAHGIGKGAERLFCGRAAPLWRAGHRHALTRVVTGWVTEKRGCRTRREAGEVVQGLRAPKRMLTSPLHRPSTRWGQLAWRLGCCPS